MSLQWSFSPFVSDTLIEDEPGKALVHATSEALAAGLEVCAPGRQFKAIGNAIYHTATEGGYSVSSQFAGHGIGKVFHRTPWILHHRQQFRVMPSTL